jgi:putative phage-type endonuclease
MDKLIQGSDEWFEARLGKVTASRISDVVAQTKSGWGASRAKYMGELIAETMTKTPTASYSNSAMQWGSDTEPEAAKSYSFYRDLELEMVGFVNHPKIDQSGCSPDRLVGKDGLVEIKCPLTHTHIETLLDGKVPQKYLNQMLWQMACTERQWCDFVSFDPRMPVKNQIFIKRVERDQSKINELEEKVIDFLNEMNKKINELESLNVE